MSVLDTQIMQDVSTLPEAYKQTVLDLIASLKRTIEQENPPKPERRIGCLKGLKFLADGVELDDFDDEIAEMFEESEIFN